MGFGSCFIRVLRWGTVSGRSDGYTDLCVKDVSCGGFISRTYFINVR